MAKYTCGDKLDVVRDTRIRTLRLGDRYLFKKGDAVIVSEVVTGVDRNKNGAVFNIARYDLVILKRSSKTQQYGHATVTVKPEALEDGSRFNYIHNLLATGN